MAEISKIEVGGVEYDIKDETARASGGLRLIGSISEQVEYYDEYAKIELFGQDLANVNEDDDGMIRLNLPDEMLELVRSAKIMHVECVNNDGAYLERVCYGYMPVSLVKDKCLPVSFSAEFDSWGDPWDDEYDITDSGVTAERYVYFKNMLHVLTYTWGITFLDFKFYV